MAKTDTQTLQKQTEVKVFQPTPLMRKWLDAAIETMSVSPTEIQRASNIDRQRWYEWRDVPGFRDWFFEEYKKERKVLLPVFDAIGMKYAARGSVQHWLEMKRTIEGTPQNSGVAVQVNNIIGTKRDDYEL